MSAQPTTGPRFIRKTELAPNEYRRNFKQLDNDVIEAITSAEADEVTPLMAKIYLRLLRAPSTYWERAGVLRFEAEFRGDERVKAWTVLCELLRASSATVNKALRWMHEQGIIGYFSGKNGAGIRIFLNRAASSVGIRPISQGEKILPFSHASFGDKAASSNEAAFKEPYGNLEILDVDKIPRTPKGGAEETPSSETRSEFGCAESATSDSTNLGKGRDAGCSRTDLTGNFTAEEFVRQVGALLQPAIVSAAAQAAAREHDHTREWLEKRGLPKVARVAQREAFNILRQCGAINPSTRRARSELMVGSHNGQHSGPRPLSPAEIEQTAEICLWMLESRGQSIDMTLAEISAESGGYLLAEDAPKVRELASLALSKENSRE